jgi:hypothetical protein
MAEQIQDVSERAKLIGCLLIWSLFLVFALVAVFWRPANGTLIAIIAVSIFILSAGWESYLRWRDHRALSARVRSELQAERCHRCGSSLETWNGQFWPVGMHVDYSLPARNKEYRWLRYSIGRKCPSCS